MFNFRDVATAAALLLLFACLQVALANEDSSSDFDVYEGNGTNHASSDEDSSGDESVEMDDHGLSTVEQVKAVDVDKATSMETILLDGGPSTSEQVVFDQTNEDEATPADTTLDDHGLSTVEQEAVGVDKATSMKTILRDDGPSTSEQVVFDQTNEDEATLADTTLDDNRSSTVEQVVPSQASISQVNVTEATTEKSTQTNLVTAAEQVAARQVKVVDEAITDESVQVNNLGENAAKNVSSTSLAPVKSTTTSAKSSTKAAVSEKVQAAIGYLKKMCKPDAMVDLKRCIVNACKMANIPTTDDELTSIDLSTGKLVALLVDHPDHGCVPVFEMELCIIDGACKYCNATLADSIAKDFKDELKYFNEIFKCKPYTKKFDLSKEGCHGKLNHGSTTKKSSTKVTIIIVVVAIAVLLACVAVYCLCCTGDSKKASKSGSKPLKSQLSGSKMS